MATQSIAAETTLRIRRTFAAPREKVFRAWIEAEALTRWFAPNDEYRSEVLRLDARPGGSYRFRMTHRDGAIHTVAGTYREVLAPERLVFTWKWEEKPEMGDTLVRIEFADLGGATELTLTHERFPDLAARLDHEKGWGACLDRLEKKLA